MILAIDQGTTGTTCLVFDDDGAARRRAPTASSSSTSRARLGRARRRARSGRSRARVANEALDGAGVAPGDLRGDRDHQPARDRRRLGPATRGEPLAPRDRLAGPPHRGALRASCARRATSDARARAHRAGDRPLLLGDEDRVAARERRGPARRGDGAASGRSTPGSSSSSPAGTSTDYSNASRTLLFDIRELAWDAELCELLRRADRAAPRGVPAARRLRRDRPGRVLRRARAASRASRATSRRRCSARRASRRGSARTPTGPAASCS